MRGVIFNSMISTTVTMPAMIVLAGMAAYWIHRRFFPGSERPDAYAFLTALVPFVILVYGWPSGYVSSSKTTVITCCYILYYLVGLSIYCVAKQAEAEGRGRVFRFFFVLLGVVAMIALLLTIKAAVSLLAFLGTITLLWAAVYLVTKSIASPVWTWTPPPKSAAETVDAQAPAPPEPSPVPPETPWGLEKFFLRGAMIIGMAWLCLNAYALNPLYVPIVLFWTGFTGIMLAKRETAVPSPAPSPPSQETG